MPFSISLGCKVQYPHIDKDFCSHSQTIFIQIRQQTGSELDLKQEFLEDDR